MQVSVLRFLQRRGWSTLFFFFLLCDALSMGKPSFPRCRYPRHLHLWRWGNLVLQDVGSHTPIVKQRHISEEQIPQMCVFLCVETGFYWFRIWTGDDIWSTLMNLWETENFLSSRALSGSKSLFLFLIRAIPLCVIIRWYLLLSKNTTRIINNLTKVCRHF